MGSAGAPGYAEECGDGFRPGHGRDRNRLGDDGSGYGVFWVSKLSCLAYLHINVETIRNLYSTFITPWADQSAARAVEPDFHLPTCYASVQAPPPGPNKATAFSDETLFFMFYSSPRDALQEVAAQELCVFLSLY